MQRTITGKKKKGRKRLLLLLLFAVGAAGGWYLKDAKNRAEALKASEDIPGLVSKVGDQVPGLVAKISSLLENLDLSALSSAFMTGPLPMWRAYDAVLSTDIRDILAEGLPRYFAYPYLCSLERIFEPETGAESAEGSVPLLIGRELRRVGAGAVIYPGTEVQAPQQLALQIKCRGETITIAPASNVSFLRGEGVTKVLAVAGTVNVRTEGNRSLQFQMPWGEISLTTAGISSLQLGARIGTPVLTVYDGEVDIVTAVSEPGTPGASPYIQVTAGTNAKLKVTRLLGADEEIRNISPRKSVIVTSAGRFADDAAAAAASVPEPIAGAGTQEKIEIAQNMRTDTTPWYAEKNVADMTLNWSLRPTSRAVPCTVDLSVDPRINSVLASYPSQKMTLLLKGIQPATYYWRVRCESGGKELVSTVAKIVVLDGKKNPPAPKLIEPKDGATSPAAITFRWEAMEGARGYVLQLSRFKDFRSGNPYKAKSPGLRMNLKKKGSYYWRVFAIGNSAKFRSAISPAMSFTY